VAGERCISAVHLQKKSVVNDDLTAASVSRWLIIMIGPGGLLLVVPPPICCPSFSFIDGVAKEYITTLECEKYFLRVTY